MEKEWKTIKIKRTVWEISSDGEVKRNGKLLDFSNETGYIKLSIGWLHRVVASLFIPNPDNKPCVDHINTIKTDNRVENLRWVTYSENNLNEITRKRNSEAQKTAQKEYYKLHPERAKQHSECMKNKWKDTEFRENMINIIKEVQQRPETKSKISYKTKKLWENEKYKQMMIASSHTPEAIEKQSNTMKKNWEDPLFVAKMETAYNNWKETSEYIKWRQNISNSVKGELNGFYGKSHTTEQREKWSKERKGQRKGWKLMSKDGKATWVSPENFNTKLEEGYKFGRK